MILIESDFSPQAAAELQEKDNIMALEALLYFAGLEPHEISNYMVNTHMAARRYEDALGEPGEDGKHTDEQWAAAITAAEVILATTNAMLTDKGVTIVNILVKTEDPEHYFSYIQTTIYTGAASIREVAQIKRPVLDIEAQTYENNCTGYGKTYPDMVEPLLLAAAESAEAELH